MSSRIQLQVKPRRVPCERVHEPPPFSFAAAAEAGAVVKPKRRILLPLRMVAVMVRALGYAIDTVCFLVGLTLWCALHMVLWSYAFDMGPAANCFSLPCPPVVAHRVLLVSLALAMLTYIGARVLRRLGHRATATVMLVLVTFDVAATLLLAVGLFR
ncbi:MAG: hypothetical protein JWN41_469 [Thermoleophilia bacterium]|nr:hypothetical protein [Thermoleophilia bacterium]